ncbi:hypothetical protein [Mycobacterium sp.]|jgi:hypothetical protein|uniref:hypothetical protein n=1 Tax=Mycobacterium sp. TaxID=1785 RepID=UPI002C0C7536|nr:hypothetical protein [Mycobacterium sp.]HXB88870.1 hypothetical protein [Mycobacterium sp.]
MRTHNSSKSLKLAAGALVVALAVFGLTGCGGGGRGGGGHGGGGMRLAPSVISGS